jgi:hypothetical protein
MDVRVAKLEVAVEGLKRSQDLTLYSVFGVAGLVIAVAAILMTLSIYSLTRIDALGDRLSSLDNAVAMMPAQISADLKGEIRDITQTLGDAILAAKNQPPQVILLPAPEPPPPSP